MSRAKPSTATSLLEPSAWKFKEFLTPWGILANWIITLMLAAAM
jgi:hypothetical protein